MVDGLLQMMNLNAHVSGGGAVIYIFNAVNEIYRPETGIFSLYIFDMYIYFYM